MNKKVRLSTESVFFLLSLLIYLTPSLTKAQNQKIVQLTGVVLAEDGNTELPGIHVYVPLYGRGTTTNSYGYFSMPVLVGDRIVLSSVGYVNQEFIVSDSKNGHVNAIFQLETDTVYLDNLDISPYLSEKMFKQVILSMNMPAQEKMIGNRLDGAALAIMVRNMPYDAGLNASYYFNQQLYYMQDSYGPRSNPFLNPFNWSKFIKALGDKK